MWAMLEKLFAYVLFTPGFSQLSRLRETGNRLNGFPVQVSAVVTWLKPGVNKKEPVRSFLFDRAEMQF
jgi:hypothetical protein